MAELRDFMTLQRRLMIERFRKEIDWNAADCAIRVTNLFRLMLFEYVQDYASRFV